MHWKAWTTPWRRRSRGVEGEEFDPFYYQTRRGNWPRGSFRWSTTSSWSSFGLPTKSRRPKAGPFLLARRGTEDSATRILGRRPLCLDHGVGGGPRGPSTGAGSEAELEGTVQGIGDGKRLGASRVGWYGRCCAVKEETTGAPTGTGSGGGSSITSERGTGKSAGR